MVSVGIQWAIWTVLPPVTAGPAAYSPVHRTGWLGHSVGLCCHLFGKQLYAIHFSCSLQPSRVIVINCNQTWGMFKHGTSNLKTTCITRGPYVTTYTTWGGISQTYCDLVSRVDTTILSATNCSRGISSLKPGWTIALLPSWFSLWAEGLVVCGNRVWLMFKVRSILLFEKLIKLHQAFDLAWKFCFNTMKKQGSYILFPSLAAWQSKRFRSLQDLVLKQAPVFV